MPVSSKKWLLAVSAIVISSLSACSSEPSSHTAELMEERAAREAAENSKPELLVDIVNADASLSTLERAVEASGVAEELRSQGPFTGFAPDNAAFDRLEPDKLSELLAPEGKEDLEKLIKSHIVSGTLRSGDILKAIDEGGGSTTFLTLHGGQLTATRSGENIVLQDDNGNRSVVTNESEAKNGVLYTVDTVLMPN